MSGERFWEQSPTPLEDDKKLGELTQILAKVMDVHERGGHTTVANKSHACCPIRTAFLFGTLVEASQ